MKTKIRKYCFPQYFWLIIWTIPKNVNFDQKTAVRGAISQKEGIEILQDAPHIKVFWIPDQVVSSAFMEMKVTLEEGCGGGKENIPPHTGIRLSSFSGMRIRGTRKHTGIEILVDKE